MATAEAFKAAVLNIAHFGDTDVFPLPLENHVLHDSTEDVVNLLCDMHDGIDQHLNTHPPINESTMGLVGYTGFRWATQIDPIWNAYFLGLVISIGAELESERIDLDRSIVFSYRYEFDEETYQLFRPGSWPDFLAHSRELADGSEHVLVCDLADFYSHVYHHRIENALAQLGLSSDTPHRIMDMLSKFQGTVSYGLPIGGPAARLLAELVLNRTDRLLLSDGLCFCRYADDYHVFVESRDDAFAALVSMSEKLLRNDGLALQKAKTRISTSAEFSTRLGPAGDSTPGDPGARTFLSLSLRYDPYSLTALEDYEALALDHPPDAATSSVGEQPSRSPERSILVFPSDERNLEALLELAEPLTRRPRREIMLTMLAASGDELARSTEVLGRQREALLAKGVATRAAAFTSASVGSDLVRLVGAQEVDLMLTDAPPGLLVEGLPPDALQMVPG